MIKGKEAAGKRNGRGFVTMATGSDEYYVLAHNLLLSYRYHSFSKTPFAIICDRENRYTADFDLVILMDSPEFSVFDKLKLPELAPFDETIFIEADCLAYRDLNGLWRVFKDSPDFGGLGIVLPLDSPRGWIPQEHLGPYRDLVKRQFLHQGGVYFMRKKGLGPFIRTVKDIRSGYDAFHFRLPNEEPVFILACMLHGYMPVRDWLEVFCFYPACDVTETDIRRGRVRFSHKGCDLKGCRRPFLVHWGTPNTREGLYQKEAGAVVSMMQKGRHAASLIAVRRQFSVALDDLESLVPVPVKLFLRKLVRV